MTTSPPESLEPRRPRQDQSAASVTVATSDALHTGSAARCESVAARRRAALRVSAMSTGTTTALRQKRYSAAMSTAIKDCMRAGAGTSI